MARPPKKQQVDYFPHMCKHGETMYIVEQRYGNDGYAFWFKLLEMLGSKSGHALDANQPDTWEFLQARTRCSSTLCSEILDLLAKLGAIDKALWTENRLIWSQNLVDNLTHVYNKRQSETPQKPSFRSGNPEKAEFPERKPEQSQVSVTEIRQRKGEERKGEERMVPVLSEPETKKPSTTYEPDTDHLNNQVQNAFSVAIGIYPEPGLQTGIADGQAVRVFASEVKVAEHGPFLRACQNYRDEVDADGVEPKFVRRLVNFIREGFWRNYVDKSQPQGTPFVPDLSWQAQQDADDARARANPRPATFVRPAFLRAVHAD